MPARLSSTIGSSTKRQRQVLHQLKRKLGWSDDQLHDAIGFDSTTKLSSAQASACIRRLGGGELSNPPGRAPRPYGKRKAKPGITRMIAEGHIEQIHRLLVVHFGDSAKGLAWLHKNFGARHPGRLLTAKRAGQVIYALKTMIARETGLPRDFEGSCSEESRAEKPARST